MGDKQNASDRGQLAEQILDRIASDPEFRQKLLNNPTETLDSLGYSGGEGVQGYAMGLPMHFTAGGNVGGGGDALTDSVSCPPCADPSVGSGVPQPPIAHTGAIGQPPPKNPKNYDPPIE